MSERDIRFLSDLSDVIDSRHKTPSYTEEGFPMVRVVDVTGGKLNLSNTRKVSKEVYEDFSKGRDPEVGDLVITRVGSYGNLCYVNSKDKFCLGQNTALIVPKNIDWRYLYFQLISPSIKHQIEVMVVGAVQKTISLKNIKGLEVLCPPLPEQKAIAHVLGKLDDKIELNRKMNETLEGMAQALFKSWFVDFDPVLDNALAAGNPIPEALQSKAERRKAILARHSAHDAESPDQNPGTPLLYANPELAEQFPDRFTFNETLNKWIPVGWGVEQLNEIANISAGGDKPKCFSSLKSEKCSVPIYSNGLTNKGLFGFTEKANYEPFSITISARGTIGYTELRTEPFDAIVRLLVVKSYDENLSFYLLYHLRSVDFNYTGSVQRQLTRPHIAKIKVITPSHYLIDEFHSIALSKLEKVISNNDESETLTKLRDTLLPQLINGKVRLPEEVVERFG